MNKEVDQKHRALYNVLEGAVRQINDLEQTVLYLKDKIQKLKAELEKNEFSKYEDFIK